MTTSELTPLPPRTAHTPYEVLVRQLLEDLADGSSDTDHTVARIVQAHEVDIRRLASDVASLQRVEAETMEQQRQAHATLEFVQSTTSTQMRRTAHLYAQVKADQQMKDSLAYAVNMARLEGRPLTVQEIEGITTRAAVIPMDLPTTVLAIVRDNSTYRYGVFRRTEGDRIDQVHLPYVGFALVTTDREPQRITEPAFLAGARIHTASVLASQGLSLLNYA